MLTISAAVFAATLVRLFTWVTIWLIRMKPVPSKKVADGIYAIKDGAYRVNLYIISTGNNLTAIDCGSNKNKVKRAMQELGLSPCLVKAVFLTHSDRDHVGGLGVFLPDVQFYMAKNEEQMVNGNIKRGFFWNHLKFCHNRMSMPHNVTWLTDGHEVKEIDVIGIKVRCISTPGHTPGSMSYVVNGKYLFSGDTLSLKKGKAREFAGLSSMDMRKQRESIKTLADVPNVEYLFTSHYGYSSDPEAAFADWKDK